MGKMAAIINLGGAHITQATIEEISTHPTDIQINKPSLLIKENIGFSYTPHSLTQHEQLLECSEKRFILICDARIDNRHELLDQIRHSISVSEPPTDANIILAAYRKWGTQCPAHLIGDFAFVIWDNHKKSVFASRDAMNMRTLSYNLTGNTLYIATEGAQLLQSHAINTEINKHALASWLSGWPDPNASMFKNIHLLPAGHYMLASADSIKIECYWKLDPEYKIHHNSTVDYEDQLRGILSRSVNDRMQSTKGVIASQMSGGMDSTSVTALANYQARKTHKEIAVISHTYKTISSCDESEKIKEMLLHLDLNNAHYMPAEQHSALDFRELYPPSIENPGTVNSPRYTDEMNLIKSLGADVLLTGSGGDEMTWGHSLTYSHRLLRGDLKAIQEVICGCKELQLPLLSTLLHLFITPLFPQRFKQNIRKLRGKPPASNIPLWIPHATRQLLEQEKNNMSNSVHFDSAALQARYDAWKNSSTINSVRSYHQSGEAFGIEVRHPFFDRRLLEFSFAIPEDLWIRENYPKWLLRRSMAGLLPNSVCWNKHKVIFDGFFSQIIRSQKEIIQKILSDKRLEDMGLVDNKKLLNAFDAVMKNQKSSLNVDLLYALMAQIWFQRHAKRLGH
ncbi:Asparagine synthetase [glutamine-hydrolyzing] [hydrothermal vent metagenome]|uniref:Asparagine synthetase [glutamine-hydrolyzing] n=1 Tax=hydrothermal vent metagenome TaxID=652676 RepID=A0A3B0ZCB7_9ZZZZ